jgi:hypothetical protein
MTSRRLELEMDLPLRLWPGPVDDAEQGETLMVSRLAGRQASERVALGVADLDGEGLVCLDEVDHRL